jgi:hypothetical protein
MLNGGPLEELLSVYVPRPESEIRRLLEDAREMETSASSEIEVARRLAAEADGRQKIMSEEIKTTQVRRDVAKKAKDEPLRATLDAAVKKQSNEKKYLEHLRDALRADASSLEADRKASAMRVKALELELQAAQKHAEISAGVFDPAKVPAYQSLLRNLLEAQKQSADAWKDASGKRKQVAERRLKQLQSLSKL